MLGKSKRSDLIFANVWEGVFRNKPQEHKAIFNRKEDTHIILRAEGGRLWRGKGKMSRHDKARSA